MAGPGGDGDLRHLLKLHRTEIAMAVDDVFPLLHGLADHDVVPEHVFKETLNQTEREGSHRAFHALLTWLLGRDVTAVRAFWAVLFKDYNLERYTRLRSLHSAFPKEVDLGRQRRSRRLSPSPMAPVPHRPQGKRKAPEERDGARMAQPSPRHAASPGPLAKAKTVKKPESVDTTRSPCTSSSAKAGSRAGDELYDPAAGEEPGARSRSRSQKPTARPKALQSSGGLRATPQSCLPAPTMHSQDPTPQQVFAGQVPREDVSRRQWVTASTGATQGGNGSTPLPAPPWQENEDECAACGDGGELICCDGCPRAFHLACLVPPLPRVPSGTWQCGSCAVKLGQLQEADEVADQPPAIPGEEEHGAHVGRGNGSVCSRCFTKIPTPQHCPAPNGNPGGLLLCSSCLGTPETGSARSTAVAGDRVHEAAKAECGSPSSDPMLSRDELDALLGEGAWDGILQWAFQSMARPLADTHGLFV
ncbi:autoimmune regulator-like isoform X4 [Oxyura jamaicensis]|uniref:autoimmune regulator-like isoform X4 n=1 Tax=Oxyura jamaicensis TaxID=8884 RepID=UPI0015A52107|nr:autoimmune regulator-like isoform X4 [Oxyura jamaicensis]